MRGFALLKMNEFTYDRNAPKISDLVQHIPVCRIRSFSLRYHLILSNVLIGLYSANWCLSERHCREGALLLPSAKPQLVRRIDRENG